MINTCANECSMIAVKPVIALVEQTASRDHLRGPAETKAGTTDFRMRLARRSQQGLMAVANTAPCPEHPSNSNVGKELETNGPLVLTFPGRILLSPHVPDYLMIGRSRDRRTGTRRMLHLIAMATAEEARIMAEPRLPERSTKLRIVVSPQGSERGSPPRGP